MTNKIVNDTPFSDEQYLEVLWALVHYEHEANRKFDTDISDMFNDEPDVYSELIIKGFDKKIEFNYTPKQLEEIINNSDLIWDAIDLAHRPSWAKDFTLE